MQAEACLTAEKALTWPISHPPKQSMQDIQSVEGLEWRDFSIPRQINTAPAGVRSDATRSRPVGGTSAREGAAVSLRAAKSAPKPVAGSSAAATTSVRCAPPLASCFALPTWLMTSASSTN